MSRRDNIVASEIRAMAARNCGRVTPAEVVQEARQKGSPLHEFFDWNVKRAAEAHWLDTARRLIASVEIVVVTTNYEVSIPEFRRDPAKAATVQGYISLHGLRQNEDMSRDVLIAEFRRAAGALARAKALAHALDLVVEIEAVRRHVIDLAERAENVAA